MSKQVDFYFDFASPNAYLSHKVMKGIKERTGAEVNYIPVLLGGIFKATNNKPPMEQFFGVKNKNEYQNLEIQRFIERHSLNDFKMNPHFPVISLQIIRGAVAAEMDGFLEEYIDKVLVHMWEEPKKMDEDAVFRTALISSGLPAQKILESVIQPEIKSRLLRLTSQSVEKGTFGSPTFFLDDEIFFGKDKLADLEDAIETKIGRR